MRNYLYYIILTLSGLVFAQNRQEIPLWSEGAPGANPGGGEEKVRIYEATGDHLIYNIHNPSITPCLVTKEKNSAVAVIIAPGGGHRELWIDHEGYNIAKKLNENGINAFILKYRLANDKNSVYTVDGDAVKDMLRAIRLVRSRSAEWSVDPQKIGIIGFSAGGEVAGRADMAADSGLKDTKDPVEKFSSKPDFQALIYPGHIERIIPDSLSAPAFILGGNYDDIAKTMPGLYLKFREVNVPAELHIYANAGHGFGIRPGDKGASSHWLQAFLAWINDVTTAGKK